MLDNFSEERLSLGHPELHRRIHNLDDMLKVDGIRIRVTRCFATWPEQNALYAQGRTAPGPIVTNAKAGQSAHNFAYAADCAPDDPTFTAWHPDFDVLDDRWKDLLAKAKTCGLAEGAEWRSVKPDNPHFYLQELPATPDDEFRYTLAEGGMTAVFALIDKRLANGLQ